MSLTALNFSLYYNFTTTLRCFLIFETASFVHSDIVWAHDNYVSRRFPATLSIEKNVEDLTYSSVNLSLGIMLPLLDLANHSFDVELGWHGDTEGVSIQSDAVSKCNCNYY